MDDTKGQGRSKSLHDRKVTELKDSLEKEKGYVCMKNFIVELDDSKKRKVDLVCFRRRDKKVLGLECDSDISNEQTKINIEKLKKLKELFSQENKIELCEFSLLDGKCIKRKKPRGEVDGE